MTSARDSSTKVRCREDPRERTLAPPPIGKLDAAARGIAEVRLLN